MEHKLSAVFHSSYYGKPEEDRIYKPEGGSGWLNYYTKQVKGRIYPRIAGSEHERGDPNDYPKHWYWRYCYYDKNKKPKQVNVSLDKLQKINYMIATHKPVEEILKCL